MELLLNILRTEDIPEIVKAFTFPWTTVQHTQEKWKQYFEEQQNSDRNVCIAKFQDKLVGYGSLVKVSLYPHFKDCGVPEIHDVWVTKEHRGKGFGKNIIQYLEKIAHQEHYKEIGIGVGLYKDYGRAQRLYVELGYIPDGRGVTYKYQPATPGDPYPLDDDLVIWLTKGLS